MVFICSEPFLELFHSELDAGKMRPHAYNLSNDELGRRLRVVRESKGFTQADAAAFALLSRNALVAIEEGNRRAKTEELISLAEIYNVTLSGILRRHAVHVDLFQHFGKARSQGKKGVEQAIRTLNHFVSAEVELEILLEIGRPPKLPPEKSLQNDDTLRQAKDDALELRQLLGLGDRPISGIFSLLGHDLGIRVYNHPLEDNIFGLFAYDDKIDACMLLNSNHRYERQAWTAAHALGHAIAARQKPDVFQIDSQHDSQEGRYANAFSSAFLMPESAVRQKFLEVHAGNEPLTRRHVIILAHYFGVSWQALARRLEDLKLAPDGAWDSFILDGGISGQQAKQVLQDVFDNGIPTTQPEIPTITRLGNLAAQAMHRDLLGEGQVARLLKTGRITVRELLYEYLDSLDDSI